MTRRCRCSFTGLLGEASSTESTGLEQRELGWKKVVKEGLHRLIIAKVGKEDTGSTRVKGKCKDRSKVSEEQGRCHN